MTAEEYRNQISNKISNVEVEVEIVLEESTIARHIELCEAYRRCKHSE